MFRDVGREMDDGLECWLSVSRVRSTGGRVDEARPKARRGVCRSVGRGARAAGTAALAFRWGSNQLPALLPAGQAGV